MEKRFVYADNAATTPLSEIAFNAMKPWLTEHYGNPSSLYRMGREAKEAINEARKVVGKCLNAAMPVNEKNDYAPGEILFTGGGSQADNLAIRGFMHGPSSKGRKHIITSKIEHHAVLYTCEALEKEGYRVTYLNVDKEGHVDLEQLKNELSEDTALVSVMAANNEIGTIQPLKQISELAHSVGAKFHTDAVQAVGHMHIDVQEMGIDMLSLAGHKFRGPRGTGVLYVKKGITLEPLVYGGGQERGLVSGTENTAGFIGLAAAMQDACEHLDEKMGYVKKLTDKLVKGIMENIPYSHYTGDPVNRLPGAALTPQGDGRSLNALTGALGVEDQVAEHIYPQAAVYPHHAPRADDPRHRRAALRQAAHGLQQKPGILAGHQLQRPGLIQPHQGQQTAAQVLQPLRLVVDIARCFPLSLGVIGPGAHQVSIAEHRGHRGLDLMCKCRNKVLLALRCFR